MAVYFLLAVDLGTEQIKRVVRKWNKWHQYFFHEQPEDTWLDQNMLHGLEWVREATC